MQASRLAGDAALRVLIKAKLELEWSPEQNQRPAAPPTRTSVADRGAGHSAWRPATAARTARSSTRARASNSPPGRSPVEGRSPACSRRWAASACYDNAMIEAKSRIPVERLDR